ncbi:helicase HerA domain-containing protein [Planctomycetota bacterium]
MNPEAEELYRMIKLFCIDWRHPKELGWIVRKLERGRMTPQLARRWLKKIQPWIEEQRRCFTPFPPAPSQEELGQFDIEIGELIENPGVRVGVRVLDRPRHIITAGATGAGKSNVLRALIKGFDILNRTGENFINVLVCDFKGDFTQTADRLGRDIWDHFSATDGFRLSCGPPSNCRNQRAWISQYTKVIASHNSLQYSEGTLASVMQIAVNLLNASPTDTLVFPSLLLIEQLLDKLPLKMIARKDEYKRTLQQKIEYLRRISDKLFDAEKGYDVYEHLIKPKRCAVIDCTGLSPLLAQILVNLIALHIMFPRITARQVSNRTNLALIIDESDTLTCEAASLIYPERYSPLAAFMKQMREFGGMLCLGMVFLGQCSRFISSNASYHFILNQSEPESAMESAKTLLEPRSVQLVGSQECGHGIFKESMGPVKYGMLFKADLVEA